MIRVILSDDSDIVDVDLNEALDQYDLYFKDIYTEDEPLSFGEWFEDEYLENLL